MKSNYLFQFFYHLHIFFLLTNSNSIIVQKGAKGQELLDRVCEQVDLVEKDYYGLVYLDQDNTRNWLAADKKITKQLKSMFLIVFSVCLLGDIFCSTSVYQYLYLYL